MSTAPQRTIFRYQMWGHRIISDFDLGELESAAQEQSSDATIRILLAERSGLASIPEEPPLFEHRLENGELWFLSWKISDGYLARFPGLCSFRVFPSVGRIDCAPVPGIAASSIAHLILDQVIPYLLSLKPGFVVFHASAVQFRNEAVAVLGLSGQGKSTLAAWFAAQGFPLLTDDCLVVRWDESTRQWLAQPSYHSVRLWPDSVEALGIPDSELREFAGYSSKRRTGREVDFRFASAGAPLTACFMLGHPADSGGSAPEHSGPPEIQPLSVNEAFPALAGAVFRIDPGDPEINRREFEVLTSLAATVRFSSLRYEREYRWLPAVQEAMMKAVRGDNLPDLTSQGRDAGHPDPSEERKLP